MIHIYQFAILMIGIYQKNVNFYTLEHKKIKFDNMNPKSSMDIYMPKNQPPDDMEILDLLERVKIGATVREHDEQDQWILRHLIEEYSQKQKK